MFDYDQAIKITLIALGLLIAAKLIIGDTSVRQTPAVELELIINHIKIEGAITMFSLTSTQQVSGQLKPKNRLGAPAPVQPGSVLIETSDSNVVEVGRDPEDETKFTLKAKNPGVATITFAADADLGEGEVAISGTLNGEVVAAQAAGFGVDLGEVEEQPEA
jgi:hypothetical protein